MASVIGKRINGRTYYYLATSARVDGKPRIVSQRYLGSAEDIEAAVRDAAGAVARTRHLVFGAVAAGWATLRRLGLPDLVDDVVGAKAAAPGRHGVSIGTYLALAALHHAVTTAPKPDIAAWWSTTSADRFIRPRIDPAALDRDRIWRALDHLTEAQLARIEAKLCTAITAEVDLGLGVLVLDVPNFAAFAEPAGAGRADHDPLLTGLGLVVTRDGAVPLLSRVYRRDRSKAVTFGELIDRLRARHRALGGADPTTIFDAGQYSQVNLTAGAAPGFVGSLPVGAYADLLARPVTALRPLDPDRFAAVSALDTRATVLGASRRVILVRSDTLRAAQSRSFAQALRDAIRRLDGLAAALAAGTFTQPRERVLAEIARITRFRFNDRVLSTTLSGSKPGELRLAWRLDEAAERRLYDDVFGTQLLVTDRDEWSVDEVLAAYRARHHVESTFRMFHDPSVGPAAEPARWTDRRVAVHAMICVLAASVTHLMRHRAHQAGIDLSVRELLDQLAGIEETRLTYASTGGRPRVRHLLTDRDETRQKLFDLFGLHDYVQ